MVDILRMPGSTEYKHCTMCGFEFEMVDTLCEHGCPLGRHCHLVRCPNCHYEFPEQPRGISWFKGLFSRKRAAVSGMHDEIVPLNRMMPGDSLEVVHLKNSHPARKNNLAVFGLVPGSKLVLEQRHPSFVVKVGETELALDHEIAGEIFVKKNPVHP